MNDTLHNLWDTLVRTGLKVVACAAILIIGLIICRIVAKAVTRLLTKSKLDAVAERYGLRKYTGRMTFAEVIGKIIYYALLLFVFQLAFAVFGDNNPVSNLINKIINWIPRVVVAIVIIAVAIAIANAAGSLLRNTLAETSYGKIVAKAVKIAIIAIGAIAAVNQVGIAVTVTVPILTAFLATIAGILIVGVGGGLIQPMRSRWERMLSGAETERARFAANRAAGSSAGSGTDSSRQPPLGDN